MPLHAGRSLSLSEEQLVAADENIHPLRRQETLAAVRSQWRLVFAEVVVADVRLLPAIYSRLTDVSMRLLAVIELPV